MADIHCRKCQGTNISKAGRNPDGRQIYKCKTCQSSFMWDLKREKLSPINKDIYCRMCNGKNIVRAGKRPDGRQIYKCKDCVSFFMWDRKQRTTPINKDIVCRSCGSTNLMRSGKTTDGRQIYQCKDCEYRMTWLTMCNTPSRRTNENTQKSEIPEDVYCKKCGSRDALVKSGKRKDGRQRYKCKECVYAFTWDVKKRGWKNVEIPENIVCVHCKSRDALIGRGKQGDGRQIYYCKSCNKAFTESAKTPTQSEIPAGTQCHRCGGNNLYKVGKTVDGSLRVRCKECNISFSLNDKKKKTLPKDIYCAKCESKDITTRGTERGQRMFQCKECKYRFMWKTEN